MFAIYNMDFSMIFHVFPSLESSICCLAFPSSPRPWAEARLQRGALATAVGWTGTARAGILRGLAWGSIHHSYPAVMAMAISYNWLFQWDNKQSINGIMLVLITGISGHNCDGS